MAAQMLRNRADLRHIQAILGHVTITSRELHTHVSLEGPERSGEKGASPREERPIISW